MKLKANSDSHRQPGRRSRVPTSPKRSEVTSEPTPQVHIHHVHRSCPACVFSPAVVISVCIELPGGKAFSLSPKRTVSPPPSCCLTNSDLCNALKTLCNSAYCLSVFLAKSNVVLNVDALADQSFPGR